MGNQLIREQIIKILKSHSYHHTEGVGVKSQFKYLAEIAFECCADEIMLALDQSQFTADEAEEFINQEVEKRIAERMPSEMTLEEAEIAAKETDYACFAVEPEGNEINFADAAAFYLEGWNACRSRLTNPGDSQGTEGGTK